MSSRSLLQSVGTSQATIVNRSQEPQLGFPFCGLFSSSACLRCLFAVHLLMTIACIIVILYYNWELKHMHRSYVSCIEENRQRLPGAKNITEEILFDFMKSVTSEICTKSTSTSMDKTFLKTIFSELKNLTQNLTEQLMAHKCEIEKQDFVNLEVDLSENLSRNISLENISAMYNITFENILTSPINETEELKLETVLNSEYSKFCTIFYPHCRRARENETTIEMVDCSLKMIGKPILHVEKLSTFGTFLLETWPTKSRKWSRKRWLMSYSISSVLFEYDYEEHIGFKQPMKHYLDYLSSGTGAVVFNGSLYYHRHNSAYMVKYDLDSGRNVLRSVPNLAYKDCPWLSEDNGHETICAPDNHDDYLYDIPHNFVDFAVDENGLFVVYRQNNADFLTVSKIEGETMKVQRSWDVPELNATEIANTFIVCGVLYAVKSKKQVSTLINYSFDLRTNELEQISIAWSNPYKHLMMASYNPFQEQIYIYDNGIVISVALKTEYRYQNISETKVDRKKNI